MAERTPIREIQHALAEDDDGRISGAPNPMVGIYRLCGFFAEKREDQIASTINSRSTVTAMRKRPSAFWGQRSWLSIWPKEAIRRLCEWVFLVTRKVCTRSSQFRWSRTRNVRQDIWWLRDTIASRWGSADRKHCSRKGVPTWDSIRHVVARSCHSYNSYVWRPARISRTSSWSRRGGLADGPSNRHIWIFGENIGNVLRRVADDSDLDGTDIKLKATFHEERVVNCPVYVVCIGSHRMEWGAAIMAGLETKVTVCNWYVLVDYGTFDKVSVHVSCNLWIIERFHLMSERRHDLCTVMADCTRKKQLVELCSSSWTEPLVQDQRFSKDYFPIGKLNFGILGIQFVTGCN